VKLRGNLIKRTVGRRAESGTRRDDKQRLLKSQKKNESSGIEEFFRARKGTGNTTGGSIDHLKNGTQKFCDLLRNKLGGRHFYQSRKVIRKKTGTGSLTGPRNFDESSRQNEIQLAPPSQKDP